MSGGGEDLLRDGAAGMDNEHRVQLGLIDALAESVGDGKDPAMKREILDQLLEYSRVHFLSEQLLMRLHAYPDYEDHIHDHELMVERMNELRKDLDSGTDALSPGMMESLREFLVGHINTRDRQLVDFIGQSGPAGS